MRNSTHHWQPPPPTANINQHQRPPPTITTNDHHQRSPLVAPAARQPLTTTTSDLHWRTQTETTIKLPSLQTPTGDQHEQPQPANTSNQPPAFIYAYIQRKVHAYTCLTNGNCSPKLNTIYYYSIRMMNIRIRSICTSFNPYMVVVSDLMKLQQE